jgi:hypothetical protein
MMIYPETEARYTKFFSHNRAHFALVPLAAADPDSNNGQAKAGGDENGGQSKQLTDVST